MITIFDLVLAVLLFYAVNWIGQRSSAYGYLQLSLVVQSDYAPMFNFVLKTFTPTVFIILVAAGLYGLHADRLISGIWLVAIYYFSFRLVYNLVMGRALLLDWLSVSAQTVVGVASALLAYRHLILPRRPLFPNLDTIGNELWIVVALFLYAVFNSSRASGDASAKRKRRYLRSRFAVLQVSYSDLIVGHFPNRYIELVAYAVLVYETFNRPWVVRKVERAVFPWHSRTIGPMQVRTSARLSDRDSVHVGVLNLRKCFEETEQELAGKPASRYDIIRMALAKYNRDERYIGEVFQVIHSLWAQVAPEYRPEFERMHTAGAIGR